MMCFINKVLQGVNKSYVYEVACYYAWIDLIDKLEIDMSTIYLRNSPANKLYQP